MEAVTSAYERTLAVLREQLSATQKLLDASIAREADARAQVAEIAVAQAFPRPPRLTERPAPVERRTGPQIASVTPWDELPLGDKEGTYASAEEAALADIGPMLATLGANEEMNGNNL